MRKAGKLTAENLKQVLWETLQSVRARKIDHQLANSIASQSREIMRIVNAEIRLAEMGSKEPPKFSARVTKGDH